MAANDVHHHGSRPIPFSLLETHYRVVSKVDLFTFDVIVCTAVSVVNSDVISAIKSTAKSIEKINVAFQALVVESKNR
jgi:hypothetical protein